METNRQVKTRQCDNCQKKVSDDGEIRFGGSVFSGWFQVTITNGSTTIQALNMQKDFDFCGPECLKEFAESHMLPEPEIDSFLDNEKAMDMFVDKSKS